MARSRASSISSTSEPCSERDTEALLRWSRGSCGGRHRYACPELLSCLPVLQSQSHPLGKVSPRPEVVVEERRAGLDAPRPSWHGPSSVSRSSSGPVWASTREAARACRSPMLISPPVRGPRIGGIGAPASSDAASAGSKCVPCWTCRPSRVADDEHQVFNPVDTRGTCRPLCPLRRQSCEPGPNIALRRPLHAWPDEIIAAEELVTTIAGEDTARDMFLRRLRYGERRER